MKIEMIFTTLVVARPSSALPACENVVYKARTLVFIHSRVNENVGYSRPPLSGYAMWVECGSNRVCVRKMRALNYVEEQFVSPQPGRPPARG